MKFLYYVACIGNPDLDIKMEIQLSNLQYIYNDIKCNFDVCINCYETKDTIYNDIFDQIKKLNFIDRCYMYVHKGVLTELFLTNPHNKCVDNYDYIMFIMDDVRIIDINLLELIRIKKLLNISVLSPKILNSTYSYMYFHNDITINNFLEIYLVLLSPSDFKQFIGLYTIDNKWMWGIDLLFGYYNIRAGIANYYSAVHELPSKSNKRDAVYGMLSYLGTHTAYKSMSDITNKYKPIVEHYDDIGQPMPEITLYENIL